MITKCTIDDVMEIGRQRKKRRLDLQRTNYACRVDLAKSITANYSETVVGRTIENHSSEKHVDFQSNESVITLRDNIHLSATSTITNDNQHRSDGNQQNAISNGIRLPPKIIQETPIESSSSNYSTTKNDDVSEIFISETADPDEENQSKPKENDKVLLHHHSNILLDDVCFRFLQLIRQSQISKTSTNQWLSLIRSVLPVPNSIPSNMNNLLVHLNIFDYFQRRTVCILCKRDLIHGQKQCHNCSTDDPKHFAYILDTDITSLLNITVSRLAYDILNYKNFFLNTLNEKTYDIPFAKQYKNLLNQYPDKNLLSLILHVDGISLVKSTKLKLWLCTASIVELPPNVRVQRKNMILLSMYIGYTEPYAEIWLRSSLTTLKKLKKTDLNVSASSKPFHLILYGIIGDCPALKLILNMVSHSGYYCCFFCFLKGFHSKEAHKRQFPYSSQVETRTSESFITNGLYAEKHNCNVYGHLGTSVLKDVIDISLPYSILIDYAHVTLLRHFREVVQKISSSLSPSVRKQIDLNLRRQSFPHQCNRKLRGIEELSFIKAVELKNLLLYAFIPNFIDHLTANQIGFLALLVLGIRLIYCDKVLNDNTSLLSNKLLTTYYCDSPKYFHCNLNLVLHLHQHFGNLYEQHGPLSCVNTLPFEDFIGYISKNRNGTVFQHELLAYYYNIDVYLRNSMQEKHPTRSGPFDPLVIDADDKFYDTFINYHAKNCLCNAMILGKSTQNKLPARYMLTPTPPLKKKQKISNENFDSYPVKPQNQNNAHANNKAKSHPHVGCSSSITINRIVAQEPESRRLAQEQFETYRRRVRDPAINQKKTNSAFETNAASNYKTTLGHNNENDDTVDYDRDHGDHECEIIHEEEDDDNHDDYEEEDEENAQHLLPQQKELPDEADDIESDDGYCHNKRKGKDRNLRHDKQLLIDNNIANKVIHKKKPNQMKNFELEFDQMRSDFDNAISNLVNRIETHHNKVEKQFKSFTQQITQTTINSNLENFRCAGEKFPSTVEYNNQNLLDVYDAGDHGRFARRIMKILFTPEEMSQSILYANSTYAKPGLDPHRMIIFKDAVSARFKISSSKWDEFFNLCLHRSLTQMLCDVRRKYKLSVQQSCETRQQQTNGTEQQQQQTNQSTTRQTPIM